MTKVNKEKLTHYLNTVEDVIFGDKELTKAINKAREILAIEELNETQNDELDVIIKFIKIKYSHFNIIKLNNVGNKTELNTEEIVQWAKKWKEIYSDDKVVSFFVDKLIRRIKEGRTINELIVYDVQDLKSIIKGAEKVEPYTMEEIIYYMDHPEGDLLPVLFSKDSSNKLIVYSSNPDFKNIAHTKFRTIEELLKKGIELKENDKFSSKWVESNEDSIQDQVVYLPESTRRILYQLFGKDNPVNGLIQLFEDTTDPTAIDKLNAYYYQYLTK